ncbi:hypothetical protein EJB05_30464, partial [Eragrostis curvula]
MLVSIVPVGWAGDLPVPGGPLRRATLVLANAFLMAARFIPGLGSGFVRVVATIYNAKISPASSRGFLSTLLDFLSTLANSFATCLANHAFASMPVHLGWRCDLGSVPSRAAACSKGLRTYVRA